SLHSTAGEVRDDGWWPVQKDIPARIVIRRGGCRADQLSSDNCELLASGQFAGIQNHIQSKPLCAVLKVIHGEARWRKALRPSPFLLLTSRCSPAASVP